MKLIVDREALLDAARLAAGATLRQASVKGTPRAALAWARCEATADALTLTASDLEFWLSVRVPVADADTEGVEVLNPDALVKILREHRDAEVSLYRRPGRGEVELVIGRNRYALEAGDPAAFPDPPGGSAEGKPAVPAGALAAALRLAVAAAGEDTTLGGGRFTTDAVTLAFGPHGVAAVGADGTRQHVGIAGGPARDEAAVLVPCRSARKLLAALAGVAPDAPAAVATGRGSLTVSTEALTVSASLLQGTPVPWKPPAAWACPATAGRAALLAAVRCALVAAPARGAVDLRFSAASCGIFLHAAGKGGRADTDVGLASPVPDAAFRVDGDALKAFLASAATETVDLGIKRNALQVRAGDDCGAAFIELVAPAQQVAA
ncbi:hypothetical protein [Gemmata sp.]|uniref:hypothetical protein n=1 Tax=Gemmata sp. TaxID=1914242 RepID=UPI003F6FCB8A